MNYLFLAGTVSANGNPGIGDESFHVAVNGSVYTITFDQAFETTPVVVVTPDTSANSDQYTIGASVHDVTARSFKVSLMDFGGIPQQYAFDFLCVTPA